MSATLETFLPRVFVAYEKHRQDDPEFNGLRLAVRRKLKGYVDETKRRAKEIGVELSTQAGLHHPYVFNNYRVREQRAYLCRSDKERKKLGKFFGEALGKDAETHYIQTVLEVCVDDHTVSMSAPTSKDATTPRPSIEWAAPRCCFRLTGTTWGAPSNAASRSP